MRIQKLFVSYDLEFPHTLINMSLSIHSHIKSKLAHFHKHNKVPNILFHGPLGSGKNTLVNQFIHDIYDGCLEHIRQYVIHVNCAQGKGIRFIREDLKLFSKTNTIAGTFFKTVVLLNADKLTCDAQSALRRCIEQFSFNTRFFIVTSNKCKLLKPILSRFAVIYVPLPLVNGKLINLHEHTLDILHGMSYRRTMPDKLKHLMVEIDRPDIDVKRLHSFANNIYEKGFSARDICVYIEETKHISTLMKYKLLVHFDKMKKEYRNESLLIFTMLYFIVFRDNVNIGSIVYI